MSSMQWIVVAISSLNPATSAFSLGAPLKLTLVFGAAVWVAAIIAAAVYCAYSFNAGTFSSVLPLRFLRASGMLTTSVLFMPLATLLISVFKCSPGGFWSGSSIACYSPAHLAILSVFCVLLAFFSSSRSSCPPSSSTATTRRPRSSRARTGASRS